MRKKVDDRIRTLIENGVKTRHRSMFVIVGDKYRDQVVNLYYMLTKASVKSRPTVLWCYKDKLDISSHKKKRQKQIKVNIRRGTLDPEKADSFALFLESVGITYCLYKDSERILGNTFGMCILQDFEALTPNLLARTIETVEGGGLVLLLLRSLSSLTSLYTMVMDVHERFRTESHSIATPRFNERFILSLASCKSCVVMDDELNILPISSHMRSITPIQLTEDSEQLSKGESELRSLKEQLLNTFPVGLLLGKCCTLDQGQALLKFMDAILDKTLRSTVALLAGRGRGKSAALGLAIAGAIAAGYSNIYVTAPSPDNVKTLFEFVCKGFNLLDYKEHLNYDVVKSVNPDFKKDTVRINIYKQHRQTIQYIQPNEHEKLSQVELLVIDEAAAIPLPVVKSLLGPYLVFLSSTVNGYEGTGRSLSLKLLQQLEDQSKNSAVSFSGRTFTKLELHESIRYAPGDPVESWLHGLLCLDATSSTPIVSRLPPPSDCDLYYVNRDTLFSCHKDSEIFLQRMMALYVASHYKNSPNDLQLMADAPAHHLFVLLGPIDESKMNRLPDILCVLQVCLEGQISSESAKKSLSEGRQPFGDQIPWKFSEQFRNSDFPSMSGARIVRIAVHPNATRLGYGSTAVELLIRYYEGQLTHLTEADAEEMEDKKQLQTTNAVDKVSLLEEAVEPRKNFPPLLVHLRERRPEKLHYIGVSFGLTLDLFCFWKKLKFFPFYISQISNAVTGEHTCMVVRPLNNEEIKGDDWSEEYGNLAKFYHDFRERFIRLLDSSFRSMPFQLAMRILDPKIEFMQQENSNNFLDSREEILSELDMVRLEAYSSNLSDYHMILDLVPTLAVQYFRGRIPVTLSSIQASILLCMGLQKKDISDIEGLSKTLDRTTILSYFIKVMKKFYKYIHTLEKKVIKFTTKHPKDVVMKEHSVTLDEVLEEGVKQVQEKTKQQQQLEDNLNSDFLQQYAIVDREADFENALQNGKISSSGLISVKSDKSPYEKQKNKDKSSKRKDASGSKSKSNKKRKS